jgi:hypothetical protein
MSLIVTLLARIASLFGVSPFTIGAIAAGVITLAAGAGALVWHHDIYQSGYDKAIADIAEEDSAAIARATEKRSVWSGCRARDGQWDQSTGRCKDADNAPQ